MATDSRFSSIPENAERAYQRYELCSLPGGRIQGVCRTNDNLDHGVPTEYAEWTVSYRDRAHLAQRTGLSHTGISGLRVTVSLDGVELFSGDKE